jgi:hypothetical protein
LCFITEISCQEFSVSFVVWNRQANLPEHIRQPLIDSLQSIIKPTLESQEQQTLQSQQQFLQQSQHFQEQEQLLNDQLEISKPEDANSTKCNKKRPHDNQHFIEENGKKYEQCSLSDYC